MTQEGKPVQDPKPLEEMKDFELEETFFNSLSDPQRQHIAHIRSYWDGDSDSEPGTSRADYVDSASDKWAALAYEMPSHDAERIPGSDLEDHQIKMMIEIVTRRRNRAKEESKKRTEGS